MTPVASSFLPESKPSNGFMFFSGLMKKLYFLMSFLLGVFCYSYLSNIGFFLVNSSSMEPEIPKNTIVIVDKRFSDFSVGDIITYEHSQGSLITHRVVSRTELKTNIIYQAKGDANDYIDKLKLTQKMIMGKVIFTLPYLGFVVFGLFHPLFLMFFFYIPIGHYFGILTKRFVNQICT